MDGIGVLAAINTLHYLTSFLYRSEMLPIPDWNADIILLTHRVLTKAADIIRFDYGADSTFHFDMVTSAVLGLVHAVPVCLKPAVLEPTSWEINSQVSHHQTLSDCAAHIIIRLFNGVIPDNDFCVIILRVCGL
jgi:hypothetical protein